MSDSAVAEAPETTTNRKKPGRPAKRDQPMVSQAQAQEMIDTAVKTAVEAATKAMMAQFAQTTPVAAVSAGLPKRTRPLKLGDQVPVDTEPPEGTQIIVMKNGLGQIHPLPPEGFDMNLKDKLMAQVDKAFAIFKIATDEHPKPRHPEALYINTAFLNSFDNFPSQWGDSRVIVNDNLFADNARPLFRFERHIGK